MSASKNHKCPDCSLELKPIEIIDKDGARGHAELEYRAANSVRSFWKSGYSVEGKVNSLMCDNCGRILLFAGEK